MRTIPLRSDVAPQGLFEHSAYQICLNSPGGSTAHSVLCHSRAPQCYNMKRGTAEPGLAGSTCTMAFPSHSAFPSSRIHPVPTATSTGYSTVSSSVSPTASHVFPYQVMGKYLLIKSQTPFHQLEAKYFLPYPQHSQRTICPVLLSHASKLTCSSVLTHQDLKTLNPLIILDTDAKKMSLMLPSTAFPPQGRRGVLRNFFATEICPINLMGSVCTGEIWKRRKNSSVQFLICNVRRTELAPWHILRTFQKENESLKEQRPVLMDGRSTASKQAQ